MELEERKVLHPRKPWTPVTERNQKEWWYTGAYDPNLDVYVSWHFIRVSFADQVAVAVFDPRRDEPAHFSKTMKLDGVQRPRRLCLNYQGGDCKASYNGRAENDEGWHFQFDGGGITADLTITPTIPYFTKFDNTLSKNYGLMHFFQNRADGSVKAPDGTTYELRDALVYYDHCFGTVPRQTGWHWLAVQNEDAALASLMNYGPHAQRYSQVWLGQHPNCPANRRSDWIRLEQSVSFEQEHTHEFGSDWQITSSDLELEVRPLQSYTTKKHIPPLTRFIVDLHHTEGFVEASGKVRVDGRWLDLREPMYGVMEQHYGRW